MSDTDKTIPLGSPPGPAPSAGGPGLRRVTVLASAAAALVAVLLGAIVAFQSSDNVLSPTEVAQRLAADASSSPDDHPSGDDLSPSPNGTSSMDPSAMPLPGGGVAGGTPSVIDTVAATITLTCDGAKVTSATWSIKPGYRLDDRTQTSEYLRLRIESDVHDDVVVQAVCPAQVTVSAQTDDHGDGNGGGGKG